MTRAIEVVDISALEESAGPARAAVDRELGAAAERMGFLVITGAPVARVTAAARLAELLRIFDLPAAEKRRLTNRKHAPENDNGYRGYFVRSAPGEPRDREGFDLGGDLGPDDAADEIETMLMEHNVWPHEALLPGWRAAAMAHYAEMEGLGRLVMASLGRSLGVGGGYFERFFGGGSSTLRFLFAPAAPDLAPDEVEARYRTVIDGEARRLITPAHRDSGVLTLLWQPGGLQAQAPDGAWLSTPEVPNSLNVNFGDCLTFWTGGRLKATPHRVLAGDRDRVSVPFFFEPRFDAMIAPIPGAPAAPPVRYADHLMEKIKLFGTHATEPKGRAA